MTYKDIAVLGKGVYTIAEAARLAQVPSARIIRWIEGYERAGVTYAPLWRSELSNEQDEVASLISFADLMEAKVIAAFYAHGVRIQTVRKAIDVARELFQLERPFSSEKFQTNGKRIFIELHEAITDDFGLLDLVTNQKAFREIIQPTFKNIEFQKATAVRWWPLGKKKSVVVDPERSLGRPIENFSGVPVESIVDALDIKPGLDPTKKDIAYVARLFDVAESTVVHSAEFSKKYAA